ncbi:hypothetical protein [Oribacterium sinus]
MNKRKTGILVGTMVLASLAVIKWISLNQRLEDLEEANESLIASQNNLQLTQERQNRRTEGDIARIQEEIGAAYEHMEALSKEREEGI